MGPWRAGSLRSKGAWERGPARWRASARPLGSLRAATCGTALKKEALEREDWGAALDASITRSRCSVSEAAHPDIQNQPDAE